MKKVLSIIMIAASLMAVSCKKEKYPVPGPTPGPGPEQHESVIPDGYIELENAEVTFYGDIYECGKQNVSISLFTGKTDEEGGFVGEAEFIYLDLMLDKYELNTTPVGTYKGTAEPGVSNTFVLSYPMTLREYLEMMDAAGYEVDYSIYTEAQLNTIWEYAYSFHYWQIDSESNYKYSSIDGGTVKVSIVEGKTLVLADLMVEGESMSYAFYGQPEYFNEEEVNDGPDYDNVPDDVVNDNVTEAVVGGWYEWNETTDDVVLFFYTDDDNEWVALEILTPYMDEFEVPAGTYNVVDVKSAKMNDAIACYEDEEGVWGCYYGYGEYAWHCATKGTLTVANKGGNYSFLWSMEDGDQGGTFTGSFTGTLTEAAESGASVTTMDVNKKKIEKGQKQDRSKLKDAAKKKDREIKKADKFEGKKSAHVSNYRIKNIRHISR